MNITAGMVKELRERTGAGMMDCKKALAEAEGNMDRAIDILREKGLSQAAKKSSRIAAEGLIGSKVAEDGKSGAMAEINSETDFVAKNEEFKIFVDDVTTAVAKHKPNTLDELLAAECVDGKDVQAVLTEKIAKIGENMTVRRFSHMSVENGKIAGYVHGAGKIAVLVKLEADSDSDKLVELGRDIAMQVAAMSPKYISRDDVDQEYIDHEREILVQQALNEPKPKPEEIIRKMVEGRLQKQLREVCLLEQTFVKDSDKAVKDVIAEVEKEIGTSIKVAAVERFEVGEGLEKKSEDFASEVAKQLGN